MPAPSIRVRWFAAGLLALLGVPAVPVAGAAECPSEVVAHPDQWTEIKAPLFTGSADLVDYAIPPRANGELDFILAANDSVVMRSTDGGCTWATVYSATAAPVPVEGGGVNPEAKRIVAMRLGGAPDELPVGYLLLRSADRPIVATSTDGGQTWTEAGLGLPPGSSARQLHATIDRNRAYLLTDVGSVTSGQLFTTTDRGLTWTHPGEALSGPPLVDFVVDPVVPESIWGWTTERVLHSADAGQTWTAVDAVTRPVRTIGVSHYPPASPAVVTAYDANSAEALRSRDGGRTWRPYAVPEPVNSAASVFGAETTAYAGDWRVTLALAGQPPADVTPRKGALDALSFQYGDTEVGVGSGLLLPILTGSRLDAIWRLQLSPDFRAPPRKPEPPLAKVNLRGAGRLRIPRSALAPAHADVTLQVGEQRTVPYRLDLAGSPTPLDVFLLTDSTGSMASTISAVRREFQNIVDDLADRGIDVYFGVGDFRDYPLPGWAEASDWPYKLRRKIGPLDQDLRNALYAIEPGGGSGDDSALAATYFAATGQGQAVGGPPGSTSPAGQYWVPPDQGAEFRADALKVMLVAADVESRDPERNSGYPGPSYATVAAALNGQGIKHVGLAVGNDDGALKSLTKMSRLTRTLASAEVDCDDDDVVDVVPGDALVCPIGGGTGYGIAPAIVGLLSSVTDLQPVDITVGADRRVLRTLPAFRFENVDVKSASRLPFDLTLRCDLDTAGASYPITLSADLPTRHVASATATVECLPPAEPPQVFPPPALPPPALPLAGAAAAPPPPPPQAPNLNPNPQVNPQANPQTGLAAQEDEQFQIALVQQPYAGTLEVEELAMSARDRSDPSAVPVLLAGLGAAAACGAWQLRRRTAVARATQRR